MLRTLRITLGEMGNLIHRFVRITTPMDTD